MAASTNPALLSAQSLLLMVVIAGGDGCLDNGPGEQVVPTEHV